MPLTFGSLFAGIGGLDLGLERAGMQCKWQVEIDDYATKVLEKHWPKVPKFRDVREFPQAGWTHDDLRVDVICGGFPCQDISFAGDRGGIETTERSGLWSEYFRIVRLLRPRYVIVENVAALLVPIIKQGRRIEPAPIGRVLGDFSSIGFNAEWARLSARDFGAIHLRERIFIVAYDNESDWRASKPREVEKRSADLHHTAAINSHTWQERIQGLFTRSIPQVEEFSWCQDVGRVEDLRGRPDLPEPLVRGKSDGVPCLVDRLSCIGNAVVPQVAEWIGKRIIEAERSAAQ